RGGSVMRFPPPPPPPPGPGSFSHTICVIVRSGRTVADRTGRVAARVASHSIATIAMCHASEARKAGPKRRRIDTPFGRRRSENGRSDERERLLFARFQARLRCDDLIPRLEFGRGSLGNVDLD